MPPLPFPPNPTPPRYPVDVPDAHADMTVWPLPIAVIRFRLACMTLAAIILVPLIIATVWACVTTSGWRVW